MDQVVSLQLTSEWCNHKNNYIWNSSLKYILYFTLTYYLHVDINISVQSCQAICFSKCSLFWGQDGELHIYSTLLPVTIVYSVANEKQLYKYSEEQQGSIRNNYYFDMILC